jgi:hypothetical protein
VIHCRNEWSSVINNDHQLQQEKRLLIYLCLNLKPSALFFNENDREPGTALLPVSTGG